MTEQRGTRFRFRLLVVLIAVGLVAAVVGIVLPSTTGRGGSAADSAGQGGTGQGGTGQGAFPVGDAKRVADLDRLAAALEAYRARHGGYPVSDGACADGRFDSDAEVAFLADLERTGVVQAVPRDPDGVVSTDDDCRAMYGAKHYLYYSNGSKFALVASVDDPDAVPEDAAGVHLSTGDRTWFDGSALIADWRWSDNVYVVTTPTLPTTH